MLTLSLRSVAAGLGLALALSHAAGAADLDGPYRRVVTREAASGFLPGHHFPDRAYGLAAIPFSVGPSGTYPYQVIGYQATTCTPYSYRYYRGGCSPRGYGVY